MASPWRPAGVSFTLRLLALLLVPLLGLGVLAVQRIDAERSAAHHARDLVDDARLEQAIASVYGPAQLEQIALEGLAKIDELGVPRDLVVTVAGVDFEGTYNRNVIELDAALDRLAAAHGDVVLEGGRTLGQRLSFFRGTLETQRQLAVSKRGFQADIRLAFADLDQILDDSIVAAGSMPVDGGPPIASAGTDRIKLSALVQVLESAGDRGMALLDGLLERSPSTTAHVISESARLDLAIEQLDGVLTEDERLDLDELVNELQPVPDSILALGDTDSIATAFDPDYIKASAGAVLGQLAFLTALEAYSNDFHTEVVADLGAQAVKAEGAALRTQLLVLATGVLSIALLLLVTWSTLRPLHRLTRRARTITDGTFDSAPIPLRGPRDVRALTSTMNTMATTLQAVGHEVTELASGTDRTRARELPGAIGISIDQSFRRLETMTARLHASEQLASAIVEQAADAIWTIDAHGLITSANGASVELVGVSADEQVGMPLSVLVPQTDGEVTITSARGVTARLLVASSQLEDDSLSLTTVIARDISERMRFEERLAYQAHHDALTGLPNRFAVLEALAVAPGATPLAVLFVDLDGFKAVNDMQGHLAGDRVLTEVGRRLSESVRPGDFVGRLGGDEFVIVIHDSQQDADVIAFGYRLIQEVEQPYMDGEHLFALSASIGIATFSAGLAAEGLVPLDAIRRADSAVYAAKAHGRGRVEVFDAALQNRIVHDAEIELELRNAVRNDELELHLQPVLDITTGTFVAAEALVRWNRPGHGMVPPGDFIPVAEKSTLIEEISRWVLTTSCDVIARWEQDEPGTSRRIAVNIAGSHLLGGNLIADIDAALLLSGASPHLLELELTETQLMDDYDRATTVLEDIRSRGITVAIDDFGTGYSSMAYLRELPIDTLKIDRSFVAPLADPGADTTVIDALVTIGHALGLSIVAEGIEVQAQLDHLAARGCDRAQGFLLAHPMPIDRAEDFVGARVSELTS